MEKPEESKKAAGTGPSILTTADDVDAASKSIDELVDDLCQGRPRHDDRPGDLGHGAPATIGEGIFNYASGSFVDTVHGTWTSAGSMSAGGATAAGAAATGGAPGAFATTGTAFATGTGTR